jgi:hypothetical protein
LGEISPVRGIEWVHLQFGEADEEAWSGVDLVVFVVADHVADVLAQKAFDALATPASAPRRLSPSDIPRAAALGRRERRDLAGLLVIDETSVTRSRITGNVRIGVTVTTSSSAKVDIQVMHISFG